MLYWVSLAGALSGTALGQVFYRYYFVDKRRSWLFLAILFFLVVPLFSYFALKGISLGTVYMSTGLTQVLILFLSKYFLKENIQVSKMLAVGVIILGVVVYAL